MFSPQGSLRSELEDKEQGQKLRRIPEEKRERKPKEKGNYSWENVKQLYSFNFFTTDFVYRNTWWKYKFLFYACGLNNYDPYFTIHFVKGKPHLPFM